MTDLTREQITELLDGATPGPWRADGEPWNRIVWSSADNRVCFMAHSSGLNDARDTATSNLVAAAPDLARQLLATMTERDEAQAAQALVVERAEAIFMDAVWAALKADATDLGRQQRILQAFRSLADPTGVKLLAELRAEIDALETDLTSYMDAANEYARGEDILRAQLAEAQKREATETARADAAEALYQAVRELLRWDQQRGYLVPYRVRAPIFNAMRSIEAAALAQQPPASGDDGRG